MSNEIAVSVEQVSKRFRMFTERNQSLKAALMRGKRATFNEFWALRDVTFDIPEGSTFGLIGENGSGKSTLLKCIAKILRPDTGRVISRGRVAALLELGSGFHPELSGRENVYLNGSILGLSRKELDAKFDEIVDFSGIEKFIDQPVKNYSSGMYVRLGFAIAINIDPDILLVDEILAVGDAAFQEKCMEKFADFRRAGKTVIVVSHAMGSMRTMCDYAAWLKQGQLVEVGTTEQTVDDYVDATHAQRDPGSGSGQQARWGSGEATLTAVELINAAGVPTASFRTGDRMTIRLNYHFAERIEQPVFALNVNALDGYHLWGFHSRDGGRVPEALEGAGSIELEIPQLMLQPGTFDLTASIVDYSTTHVFDFLRNCARFDVEVGTPRESGGPIALGGRWGQPLAGAAPGADGRDVAGLAGTGPEGSR
ncbi:ABC transporter ATP-binding protein [Nakamurella multipartita]|uniref:ABC transporter related n=1 Tax=Nakamurella multipartita (strain ATCC 700099 / DSM 44233 / CIP 104796 / JCM 9543 / NBRC 105858 / Y-104) TaxID=479431 RepID=C8XIM8_NAKMY|nr:ABC transporter ATP-binding protein [Nakamurella multipartita]ACV80493.1 ABC transporter related [Nakamurella multipartita DSM 44233]